MRRLHGLGSPALPMAIPPLPPYSSTTIIRIIATRLALLPVSIWVRFSNQILLLILILMQSGKRTDKKSGGIRNTRNRETQTSCQNVFEEMTTSNIRGDKRYFAEYQADRCIQLVCLR